MRSNYKFSTVDKGNKSLKDEIYKFRYIIYVNKCKFLDAKHYTNDMEFDIYDDQSVHLVAQDSNNNIVGTMRIIAKGRNPLPIEKFVSIDDNSAEISRLIINENLETTKKLKTIKYINGQNKIQMKEIALGMYKLLYKESQRLEINNWYALMEKKLHFLLSFYGFKFDQIGEEVNYLGQVYPFKAEISKILSNIKQKCPQIHEFFVN